MVDLVDREDNVVGTSTLVECLKKGLLHRAVVTIVRRTDAKVLLQRRSKNDLWHPGLWTLSSTGHIRKGEASAAAARRELWEELGLRGKLTPFSRYLLPPIRSGEMTEQEWVSIYTAETDDPVRIDPVEVDSVQAFTISEATEMQSSRLLTPDARIILRLYLDRQIASKKTSKNQTR